jgi:hypothetical protein
VTDDPGSKTPRPWRVIAEEASREYDPRKMAELMRELDRALEEQIPGNSGTRAKKNSA